MKISRSVMMVVLFNIGVAQAEPVDSQAGLEQARTRSSKAQPSAEPAQAKPAAPGGREDPGQDGYLARRQELAIRLVWLMLSAR